MLHRILLAFVASLALSSCLALPAPEELFQSRSVIATRSSAAEDGKFQIWIPYVGQGDATLMIFPNGKNLLIDAGPPGAAKTYLLPLFEKLKIKSLDTLVVTHYDLDHIGGVPEIFAGSDGILGNSDDIRILAAYDRGGVPWDSSAGYGKYLGSLEEWKVPRFPLAAGDSLDLDSALRIRCVAANGIVGDGVATPVAVDISPAAYSGRENAASIALLFEHHSFRYLTAGDLTGGGSADGFLTPDIETPLASLVGEVDAIHMNHHGSLSSSNEAMVATSPALAFVQAGIDNSYGHPVAEVLQRWTAAGVEIYSTAEGEGFVLQSGNSGASVQRIE